MSEQPVHPLGRRVQKIAGAVTRKVTYDGEDIRREKVVGVPGVGNLRYIHGPGIDEPLGFENITTAAMTYYHADGLGSIVRTTDSTGAVTSTRTYDSFGRPSEKGADQPGYSYTGREWDPETELYYYRARYYDPKIGRFLSEDPIGFEADVNFYAYVENNPVNVTDPWGLIGEAGGGRKPKPPAPTPTPRSSPGPTISHRPRHTLQGVLNLCPAPSELIFWDFFPSNPHYAQFQGPFKVWRDAFVDACNAAQLPGTYTSSYFGIANPTPAGFTIGMYQFGSPVGIGCCCREKCSK